MAIVALIKGFKMKMKSDIIVTNNVKAFVTHFLFNYSVEWLLISKAEILTRENFLANIKVSIIQVLNIFLNSKDIFLEF